MHEELRHIIGIDPGVRTGFSVWDLLLKKLTRVETDIAYGIELRVLGMAAEHGVKAIHVLMEDARLRKWFGSTGPERWKGAGSVMRDCGRWVELMEAENISYTLLSPEQKGRKWNDAEFKRYTGWVGITSEHSRDAGKMVHQFNPKLFFINAKR
jgi:hypothetical protein